MATKDSTFFLVNVTSSNGPQIYSKISPQDAELILLHKWRASGTTLGRERRPIRYANCVETVDGKKVRIKMHRLIMNAPAGMHVDHINGDTLDNRRENLRIATPQQNQANSRKYVRGHSNFKGVSWSVVANKWRAYIVKDKKQIHLGLFDDEIEAAKAYDAKAKQLYGEFAFTNI